jgi:hypothetical protein
LVSSFAAARLAKKHPQRTLIIAAFITTLAGTGVLLALVLLSTCAHLMPADQEPAR